MFNILRGAGGRETEVASAFRRTSGEADATAGNVTTTRPALGPILRNHCPVVQLDQCFTMASPRPVPPGSRARDFLTR
jgi:hypothetical protein